MQFPLEIRLIIARYCDPETILYMAETTGDYDFLFLSNPVELEQLKYIRTYIHRHIRLNVRDIIPESETEKIRQFCFPENIGNQQKALAKLLVKKSKIMKSVSIDNPKVLQCICAGVLNFNNLKKMVIYPGFMGRYIHDPKHFPSLSELSCGCKFFENNEIPTGIQNVNIFAYGYEIHCPTIDTLSKLQYLNTIVKINELEMFLEKNSRIKNLSLYVMQNPNGKFMESYSIIVPEFYYFQLSGFHNSRLKITGFLKPESLISLDLKTICEIDKKILHSCINLKNLWLWYDIYNISNFYKSGIEEMKSLETLKIQLPYFEFVRKEFIEYINLLKVKSIGFSFSIFTSEPVHDKINFTKIRASEILIECRVSVIDIPDFEFNKNLKRLYIKSKDSNAHNFDISYTNLNKLEIYCNNIDLDTIKLPETLECLKINSACMNGILDLRHFGKLRFLIIKTKNSDFIIKIPDSLFYLNLTPQKPGIVFPNSGIYLTGKYI